MRLADFAVDLFIEIVGSIPADCAPGLRDIYAMRGLGNLGEAGPKGIPVLEQAMGSSNERQLREAREALKKLIPTGYYEPLIELRFDKVTP